MCLKLRQQSNASNAGNDPFAYEVDFFCMCLCRPIWAAWIEMGLVIINISL